MILELLLCSHELIWSIIGWQIIKDHFSMLVLKNISFWKNMLLVLDIASLFINPIFRSVLCCTMLLTINKKCFVCLFKKNLSYLVTEKFSNWTHGTQLCFDEIQKKWFKFGEIIKLGFHPCILIHNVIIISLPQILYRVDENGDLRYVFCYFSV
jgi:hypothetical protein